MVSCRVRRGAGAGQRQKYHWHKELQAFGFISMVAIPCSGVTSYRHCHHRDPQNQLGKHLCQGHRALPRLGGSREETDVAVGNTGSIAQSERTCY